MNKKREFTALKWLVFPSMSLTLAAIVAWFNVTIFGWRDGIFYIAAVAVIALFSVAITKYVGADNMRLAVAAFVVELLLILVLGANAIYCLSVQREMVIARQSEASRSEDLKTITKLRSRTAQRDATRMLADNRQTGKSSQQVFAENERMLLWVMAVEMLAYVISAFTLLGLSHLWRPKTAELADEFPALLALENRSPVKRPNLAPKMTTSNDTSDDTRNHRKTTPDDTGDGFKRLRDALRLIAFEHPPCHFKVDLSKKADYLIIRRMKSRRGDEYTTHSVRAKLSLLDDATTMTPDAFRTRLERFLIENEFPL